MKNQEISVLANVLIAFSTFIGVGGAIAYYVKEIQNSSIDYIILIEITYILTTAILLLGIKSKLESKWKQKIGL